MMQSGAPNAELQVVSHDQVERTLRLGGLRLEDLEATDKRLDLAQFSLVATAHHKFHPHDPGDAKALLRGPRQLPTGRGQAAEAIDQNVGIKENPCLGTDPGLLAESASEFGTISCIVSVPPHSEELRRPETTECAARVGIRFGGSKDDDHLHVGLEETKRFTEKARRCTEG